MSKKLVFIILSLLINHEVLAQEIDITEDANIKYRWYQEKIVDEKYYPKKDTLEGYLEDSTNIQYGEKSSLNSQNCNLSEDYYKISEKIVEYKYKVVQPIRFLVFENINQDTKILVMFENKPINYVKTQESSNKIVLDLKKGYRNEKLTIILDKPSSFKLNLHADYDITLFKAELSKEILNQQIIYPNDSTWLLNDTKYILRGYTTKIEENDFIIYSSSSTKCAYQEIYTYRYKKEKKYFDENYYSHIENYIPDKENYKIYYKKDFPVATITKTINKIIKEPSMPEIEYVYIENPVTPIEPKEVIKNNYIETKVPYIPKYIYVMLCITTLICVLSIIMLINKMSKK